MFLLRLVARRNDGEVSDRVEVESLVGFEFLGENSFLALKYFYLIGNGNLDFRIGSNFSFHRSNLQQLLILHELAHHRFLKLLFRVGNVYCVSDAFDGSLCVLLLEDWAHSENDLVEERLILQGPDCIFGVADSFLILRIVGSPKNCRKGRFDLNVES